MSSVWGPNDWCWLIMERCAISYFYFCSRSTSASVPLEGFLICSLLALTELILLVKFYLPSLLILYNTLISFSRKEHKVPYDRKVLAHGVGCTTVVRTLVCWRERASILLSSILLFLSGLGQSELLQMLSRGTKHRVGGNPLWILKLQVQRSFSITIRKAPSSNW